MQSGAPEPDAEEFEWLAGDSEPVADEARPRWLRWGSNLVWVAIAIVASLAQMCDRP